MKFPGRLKTKCMRAVKNETKKKKKYEEGKKMMKRKNFRDEFFN